MVRMCEIEADRIRQINIDLVDQTVRFAVLAERSFSLARIFGLFQSTIRITLQREIRRGLDERVHLFFVFSSLVLGTVIFALRERRSGPSPLIQGIEVRRASQ